MSTLWKPKFQRSVFILHYSDLVVSHTMWVFAPSTSSSKPPLQNLSHSHENHSVSISIATWNCRGLHNSIPYIQHLISINVDIIVLQEHWPWPFQWNSLQYIHIRSISTHSLLCMSPYQSISWSETWLWRSCYILVSMSLHSITLKVIESVLSKSRTSQFTWYGVHMPSADQSQEVYSSYLDMLSSALSKLPPDSPLLIIGDLNCHLGHLGCPRNMDSPTLAAFCWRSF